MTVPRRLRFFHSVFVVFLFAFSQAQGQEEAEDSPFVPGLVATYSTHGQTATRVDEVVAFDWQNASADERLSAGDFTATWRGRLWARGAGDYRLSCYVQGQVAIKLAGKTLIEGRSDQPGWLDSQPVPLDFDHHSIEVSYRRGTSPGQLKLFWTGPDFRLEPLPAWALVHERERSPSAAFERGRQLAAALRCAACHKDSRASMTPAPSLDRLSGNLNEAWLADWLASHGDGDASVSSRRMPYFGMSREQAEAVAAWLLREPAVKDPKPVEPKEAKPTKEDSKSKQSTGSKSKKKGEEKPKPSAEQGEKLLLTHGCLACHQIGTLGLSGLFGGGDLTRLFEKRPEDFFTRWLTNPEAINRDHRMPVFSFSADELTSLELWAKREAAMVRNAPPGVPSAAKDAALLERGQQLVQLFKCAACHSLSREKAVAPAPDQKELAAASDWARSCAGQPRHKKEQPAYRLTPENAAAVKAFYAAERPGAGQLSQQARGRDLLAQLNCLACHQREGVERNALGALRPPSLTENDAGSVPASRLPALQDKLAAVAEAHAELATLVPAMTPPALNSVGDKLLDEALKDSITRKGRPHRPYMLVQMPKFELSKEQLAALTAYLVATDRIPVGNVLPGVPRAAQDQTSNAALLAAGPRLVTTDGLACTSCHQVGSVLPTKAPLNARGPDMSMLGSRIRREWFDRWCNNPARIVPRMEMPAVKIPVRGVLNDNVEDQLAAVWHILNTPGFQPPEPDPVRALRLSGIPEKNERPIVIHDVVKDGDKTYLFPLVIGLPNRHNVLFDLETNRLAAWWLGDTARQRTKGKSWYWESGAKSIVDFGLEGSELSLVANGAEIHPVSVGQFAANLEGYSIGRTVSTDGYLAFKGEQIPGSRGGPLTNIRWSQTFNDPEEAESKASCFWRTIYVAGTGNVQEVCLRVVGSEVAKKSQWDNDTNTLWLPEKKASIQIPGRNVTWNSNGTLSFPTKNDSADTNANVVPTDWHRSIFLSYSTTLPADQYLATALVSRQVAASEISIAPGFSATRLPLADDIMPSGLAWNKKGDLYFSTLKGQIYRARATDANHVENALDLVADGLPVPYGISVSADTSFDQVDVAAKDGLLRLQLFDERDQAANRTIQRLTGHWGSTDDYHDWAVGPVNGKLLDYYVALPCQQDQRSDAAAKYRGKMVHLTPRTRTPENPNWFDIEIISAGHRFPMGMARNRDGELFVTDNQGNYNPFNELNHVKPGAHFGFINALEKEKGFTPPPLTEPAINIPHPWTRSVNGICFLETPSDLRSPTSDLSIFGPLEGHLVGCEYDTRRLIRMSLDKVNGEYQGCCYPLSIPPPDVEKGLLGPIVCAIKPTTGELYVGEIRDSGWGASNNIGQITKIKIEPEKLPCGIAEVRATKTGFTIDFFKPVDRAKAADVASYAIESYRRESTPAYGGPDIDRRPERIASATVSADSKRVTLELPELRTRHVYELRLKNLAPAGAMFHPDEAHYTLKQIPKDR